MVCFYPSESYGKEQICRDSLIPCVLRIPASLDIHENPLVTSSTVILQTKASCLPPFFLMAKTNPKEPLLEDRPDHIFGGYNRGEVYNLSIRRGTLTPEESKKINSHIDMTIEMLQAIPFPSNINQVAEYAGGFREVDEGFAENRERRRLRR